MGSIVKQILAPVLLARLTGRVL